MASEVLIFVIRDFKKGSFGELFTSLIT